MPVSQMGATRWRGGDWIRRRTGVVVLAAALFCRCYLATVGLFVVALAVDGLCEPDMFPFYVDARLIGKVLLVAVFPATLDLLRQALSRDRWARARYGF